MSFINWYHKNIAEGNIDVDTTLLVANGGAGFKAGMAASLQPNGTDAVFFQLANGATKPAYGIILDNDAECAGSGKVTVATGQGWRFDIVLKGTDQFSDICVDAASTFTITTKVYAGAGGKLTTTAAGNGDAIAEVVKVPTTTNNFTLGLKLLK
jgi:hypothetical protein